MNTTHTSRTRCFCQKRQPESDQAFRSNTQFQEIQAIIEKKVQRHHKEARGQIQKATRSLKQVNVMKTKGRGESKDDNVQVYKRLN